VTRVKAAAASAGRCSSTPARTRGGEIEALELEQDVPAGDAGDIQEIVDEAGEVEDAPLDHARGRAPGSGDQDGGGGGGAALATAARGLRSS